MALRPLRATLAAFVFASGATTTFVAGVGADPADAGYDETPPRITCSASPDTLSKSKGDLQAVTATVTVTDESTPTSYVLTSVTSSEADSGLAKKDVPDDIRDWDLGTADTSGFLRAEAFEKTRTYRLAYRGFDSAGNFADCETTVTVGKTK